MPLLTKIVYEDLLVLTGYLLYLCTKKRHFGNGKDFRTGEIQ